MTEGNINYGIEVKKDIIEQLYNTLKNIKEIEIILIKYFRSLPQDQPVTNRNFQEAEKNIDRFIKGDAGIKAVILAVYSRHNVIIPDEKATEKNEVISVKKRIIRELFESDKWHE